MREPRQRCDHVLCGRSNLELRDAAVHGYKRLRNLSVIGVLMLIAKKIIAANLIVGGAILVAAGTSAVAYAMADPNCRDKFKTCADRMRDCSNKVCNRSSNGDEAEMATKPTN